jgi:hypothetical protein
MKRYIIIILAILGLLMTSCKKDIEIDYHQVDPLYVVEATVSEDGMQARISLTNNMDNNSSKSDISEALVVITGSDGSSQTLSHKGNGIYKSSAAGTPDVEYTITIDVDGRHFTSTSTMQKAPKVNDFYFIRKKIVSENFQMAKLLIQDIPNEDNYYFSHLYRNGTGYRWAVKKDDTDPNKEQQQLFTFAREGSDDKDLLREGDRIRLELRSIDRKSYDYLYSMQIMDNTGTNPIPNFTGGCLGYFSAYSHVVYNYVFHEADMKDED